jgi:16S rRNA (cytosine1402-N4)-methyltransferase
VPAGSRHRPVATEALPSPTFEAVGKPIGPSENEIRLNPRARSAKLRVARRTAAAPWTNAKRGRQK